MYFQLIPWLGIWSEKWTRAESWGGSKPNYLLQLPLKVITLQIRKWRIVPSVFTGADNTIFPPLTIDKNCFLFQQKDLPLSNLDSGEKKQYIELIAEQNFSNYVL